MERHGYKLVPAMVHWAIGNWHTSVAAHGAKMKKQGEHEYRVHANLFTRPVLTDNIRLQLYMYRDSRV